MPTSIAEQLPSAIQQAEHDVTGCGQKASAVLLPDLWAVFPMPSNDAALRLWVETLAQYPADLVKQAIRKLIESRTWERDPPLPGQVVAILRDEFQERSAYRNKLETMSRRVRMDGPAKPKTGPAFKDQSEQDREEFCKRMREKYPDAFDSVRGMVKC